MMALFEMVTNYGYLFDELKYYENLQFKIHVTGWGDQNFFHLRKVENCSQLFDWVELSINQTTENNFPPLLFFKSSIIDFWLLSPFLYITSAMIELQACQSSKLCSCSFNTFGLLLQSPRAVLLKEISKKSPNQETGLGNRRRLKVLNDTKLIND